MLVSLTAEAPTSLSSPFTLQPAEEQSRKITASATRVMAALGFEGRSEERRVGKECLL